MGVEGISSWEEVGKGRSAFEVYDKGEQGEGEEGRLKGGTVSLHSAGSYRRLRGSYQCDPHMYRPIC